jgi:beta-mannosidase
MFMNCIDLSGTWTGKALNRKMEFPCQVPGDIASALIAVKNLPHPYWARQEPDIQWIGQEDWLLTRIFQLSAAEAESVGLLLIETIDTVAEVYLNGELIGSSDNMFRGLRLNTRKLLKEGVNQLEVYIRSPEKDAQEAAKRVPYPIPCSGFGPISSPHRNLIRKVQCHAGWDWGPAIMTGGIYGNISLSLFPEGTGHIDYVYTRQIRHSGSLWELEVQTEYLAWQAGVLSLEYHFNGLTIRRDFDVNQGVQVLTTSLQIENPELWWPAGYGDQALYPLEVRTKEESVTRRIGFRNAELIVQDDDSGRSMYFRINGRNIFAKGANWIPTDALPSGQSPQKYKTFLEDAITAGMNMIRVWGGGQYEKDIFYDTCDELGLMIWQDMMFACALYPANPEFLENVRQEVSHQVKRLKDHACMVLWCGNNENVGALNWYEESRKNRDRYIVDYDRLNEGIIGKTVREIDPDTAWWPSSPSAGEGDYSDCWHDDSRGDMHYWSVWHEGLPFESYYEVTPRFCSEFGFQSFPSLKTIASYAPESEYNITSPVMRHHQKNNRGNTIILETMARYFRIPEKFEDFVYLSQVQQALAIKTAVEYWRSRRPVCMGALYWQLNDNWPAASWSSIDYYGNWKLLHYEAARFYRPVWISMFIKNGQIEIWGLNDSAHPIQGEIHIRLIDFAGTIQKTLKSEAIWVSPEIPLQVCIFPVFSPEESTKMFLDAQWDIADDRISNTLLLRRRPLDCYFEDAFIEIVPGDTPLTFTLKTDKPVFFLQIECDSPGRFSDNGFSLLPERPVSVSFFPSETLKKKDFISGLKIRHIKATYT